MTASWLSRRRWSALVLVIVNDQSVLAQTPRAIGFYDGEVAGKGSSEDLKASATVEGREAAGLKVIANIRFWADGHRPPDQVVPGML